MVGIIEFVDSEDFGPARSSVGLFLDPSAAFRTSFVRGWFSQPFEHNFRYSSFVSHLTPRVRPTLFQNTFMKFLVLAGRILFSLIFLMSVTHLFSAGTAAQAGSHGVPMAQVLVPIAGVLAVAGSLSIILGYRARVGALLIILFLIPVTFFMHNFWTITDPMQRMMQQVNFMKNISMLGGALLISYFGAGPLSIDAMHSRPTD